jgi:uncharacterized protein YodC (DUF2158 family)
MKIGDVVELKSQKGLTMTITELIFQSSRPFGCTYYNPVSGKFETIYVPEATLTLVKE